MLKTRLKSSLKSPAVSRADAARLARELDIMSYEAELEALNMTNVPRPPTLLPMSTATWDVAGKPRSLADDYKLDENQQAFVDHVAKRGKSCVLTGFAGTGKTQASVTAVLAAMSKSVPLWMRPKRHYHEAGIDPEHTYLAPGMPGVVVCALTRTAVGNLASRLPNTWEYVYTDDAGNKQYVGEVNPQLNCMTIHKLLQYQPVADDGLGGGSGNMFAPYRNKGNMLPAELEAVFIDEGTLPNLSLFNALLEALQPTTRVYVIGDIFQIQAVGGISTLAAMMTFAKVFALEKIYRYEGAILRAATAIRLQQTEYLPPGSNIKEGDAETGRMTRITYGLDRVSEEAAYKYCGEFLATAIIKGIFVPGLDMAISFHDPALDVVTNKFGISNTYRHAMSIVDAHYGRATYYVKTSGADKHGNFASILAAGDTVYADVKGERTLWLVVRIAKNPGCKSDVLSASYINTRCPRKWKQCYDAKHGTADALKLAMDEAIGAGELLFDDITSNTMDGSAAAALREKGGRQASHLVTMLDVGSLYTYVHPRAKDSKHANTLCELAIKQLTYLALKNDYLQNTTGKFLKDDEIRDAVADTLSAFGLENYTDTALHTVGNGAALRELRPLINTAHAAQGLGGRNVFFFGHGSTPGFNEMGYTSCTRARSHMVTITHPSFWGTKVNGTAEQAKHRSDLHSCQVPGTTAAAKVESLRTAVMTGDFSFDSKDMEALMERLGYAD